MSRLKAGRGDSRVGTCLLCKSCGEATDKPVETPVQDSECPRQKSVCSLPHTTHVGECLCVSKQCSGAGDTRVLNRQLLWHQCLLKERDTEVLQDNHKSTWEAWMMTIRHMRPHRWLRLTLFASTSFVFWSSLKSIANISFHPQRSQYF